MCTQLVWSSTQAEVFWVSRQTVECLTLRQTPSGDSPWGQMLNWAISASDQVLWAEHGPNGFDWSSMVRFVCLEWRGIPAQVDQFRSGEVFCYAAKAGQLFRWLLPAHISWSMNNNQHLRFAHLGQVMNSCICKLGHHWFKQFSYNRMNFNKSSSKMRQFCIGFNVFLYWCAVFAFVFD